MTIIDVDSHFQGPFTWFDEAYPELAAAAAEHPGRDDDRGARRLAQR